MSLQTIPSTLLICSYLLKKSLMEIFLYVCNIYKFDYRNAFIILLESPFQNLKSSSIFLKLPIFIMEIVCIPVNLFASVFLSFCNRED